ncbi:hypothetical protein E2C01_022850 [Portunus trituberculatus]|uniref:Uncharacterized protein n=1 Tax=Portunus trituberculatus TaxID=210409 RepID=A0A5B7E872_PORTR|nr:hypothetical protein [Portunus trituberculatus]
MEMEMNTMETLKHYEQESCSGVNTVEAHKFSSRLCFLHSTHEERHLLLPVGFACEPGNAGKSSLLMVNSEVSGTLHMPQHFIDNSPLLRRRRRLNAVCHK